MLYSILKDFAGPVATIIAASAAAYFAWQQSRTAVIQADTGIDQLRYNLFEKRRGKYDQLRAAMWMAINPDVPHLGHEFYASFDGIEFLFSQATCKWLDGDVMLDCIAVVSARQQGETVGNSEAYVELKRKVITHIQSMPERFREELSFRQLTRGRR